MTGPARTDVAAGRGAVDVALTGHAAYCAEEVVRGCSTILAGAHAFAGRRVALVALAQHPAGEPVVEVMAELTTLCGERRRPLRAAETFATAQETETEPVPISTEDLGAVMLRFAVGTRGSFVVSQTSAGHKNHLTIDVDCARASLARDQERLERLWTGRRGGPNLELVRDPAVLVLPDDSRSALPAGRPEGWNDALLDLTSAFYAAVRHGGTHASSLAACADGHWVVKLVDAIVESHERGACVALGQPTEVSA